jgi:molybdenum cofactor cytidylyltransferase
VIAGLLLASGAAHRFGSNKLIAPLAGRAVVRWAADALVGAVDELLVTVRDDSDGIRDALCCLPVRWVPNREAHAGMSSAIRAGVAALPADTEAVVVALGDQPLLDARVVARVVERWRDGGASAVSPRYEDGRGHPVLFGAALFPALLTLEGDRGARVVLDTLGDALATIDVAGPQPIDVDTREALDAVAALIERRAGER